MRIYQVPRHAFGWLLAGVVMASLPHLLMGPGWLSALFVVGVVWRLLAQRGMLGLPGRLLRFLMLSSAFLGTVYHYGTVIGPEAATCLLTAAFILKMLEAFRLRDAYVVVVLGYFVLATAFLFYQGPLESLYILAGLTVLTAALVGINQPEPVAPALGHIRLAGAMMLQSVPLMVLLFVVVPRVAPLWSLEIGGSSRTGVSDQVSPGDISNLSQSDELAFRVEFLEGGIPAPRSRYWRGLTLSEFDGRAWSQVRQTNVPVSQQVYFANGFPPDWFRDLRQAIAQPSDYRYQYRITQEPTGRNWLFTLAVPIVDDRDIGVARDMRLISRREMDRRHAYTVTSNMQARDALGLPDWERRLNLQLPDTGNPESREMARAWRAEVDSDQDFIERLLHYFNQQPFHYTLSPATLGEDTVDEFLFDTREGFCEHYASSFTFMVRAVGIPARVVVGYQGGEFNQVGNYLEVRQYDAHAWTEVWLDGHGWVEVDPTSAVAPERIELGLRRALEDELSGPAAALSRLADVPFLSGLRNRFAHLQFVWQKWVLGYDQQSQSGFLKNLLGDVSPLRVATALLVGGAVILLPLALWVIVRNSSPGPGPLARDYLWLQRWARRHGIVERPGEAPGDLVRRCAAHLPRHADALRMWGRAFEQLAYAGKVDSKMAMKHLRHARRRLRRP